MNLSCAGGCGAKATVAPTNQVGPVVALCFAFLNHLELARHGFILDGGVYWCRYCIIRKRLVRPLPSATEGNVTADAPPSRLKK